MQGVGKAFLLSLLLLVFPAWLFQRWLESHGQADALGAWYTAYCSVAWAMLGALLPATIAGIMKR